MNGIVPKDNDIAFENIDFSYEKDEFKMEKLSFSIVEKTMTALVGESGSGKTTIMDMSYFVFQDSDYQLFSESVLDEMLLGISSKDKKENTQKAKSILNVLGLDKYIDRRCCR